MRALLGRVGAEVAPFRGPIIGFGVLATIWALWVSGLGAAAPAFVIAAVAGSALGVIDARTQRLPNALMFPTIGVVVLALLVAALITADVDAAVRSALGGLALGAAYLVLYLINPAGLGFGDVKLALLLGIVSAWMSWFTLWVAALAPFLIGGVVALALLVSRRASRTTSIAFGPYMLAGTVLALTLTRLIAGG